MKASKLAFPLEEKGSLTLEAAVFMPAFIAILLVFAVLIRIVMVEAALQAAAAESAKQLSGALIPFEPQLRQAGDAYGRLDPAGWDFIPEAVRPLLAGIGEWRSLPGEALQRALSEGLKPVVWANVPDPWRNRLLHRDRLRVEDVAIPHVNDAAQMFGFVLVYDMPVPLPFYNGTLQIRKVARERVWFGW